MPTELDKDLLFEEEFPSRAVPVTVLEKVGEMKSNAVTAVQPVSAVSKVVIAELNILYQKDTVCEAGVDAPPSRHCSPVYENVVIVAAAEELF